MPLVTSSLSEMRVGATTIRCFSSKGTTRQFIDWKKIVIKAGDGGNGCSHLSRLRFKPRAGPDGGDGGDGGHVVLQADNSFKEFAHIIKHNRAENGGSGQKKNCSGKNASDVTIKVPVGTVVMSDGSVIADLTQSGQEFIAARGGCGGLGNQHFATSTDQAPECRTEGTPGEEKVLTMELMTIADIGLVGFPNAGKSTLLRAISRATPAVAAYPFTTINPHVGMVEYDDFSQIADIPGLISGAHLNKGLGHSFLRHIERCHCLLYVLDISQPDPKKRLADLQEELELYKAGLSRRPAAIVANKIDATEKHNAELLERDLTISVVPVSAKYGHGIETLKQRIKELFKLSVIKR